MLHIAIMVGVIEHCHCLCRPLLWPVLLTNCNYLFFIHTLIDGSVQEWEISFNVEAHSYR